MFGAAATLGADLWELDTGHSRGGAIIVSHNSTVTDARTSKSTLRRQQQANAAPPRLNQP
jgi:glycerophosphoryl diester phosphodiesterase